MADDTGDKTEAPTPRKRAEAREQGQIARSQDLTAAALLLAAVLLLANFGENIVVVFRDVMQDMLGPERLADKRLMSVTDVMMQLGQNLSIALAPLMIGLVLTAVFMNIIQVGFHLSSKRIEPKLEMLNPARGLKKIFGGGQGVMTLLMNLAKLTLIAIVAYSAVANRMALIAGSQQLTHEQIFGLGATIMYDISLRIAVLLLVLAIIDYAYQKYKNEQQLKMTKQEVKDEMKRMDGDPHIKQRRRQIQMQRAMQRVKQDVPTADVIVTNPTHYAIAIKYEPGTMRAPKVVAKGADFLALKIREVAGEHGVPILERPPLARALYKSVDVGQEIPEEFYSAVAEILAYVFELNGKMKRPTRAPQMV